MLVSALQLDGVVAWNIDYIWNVCGFIKVYHIDKMHKQNEKLPHRKRERAQKINPNDNTYIYIYICHEPWKPRQYFCCNTIP